MIKDTILLRCPPYVCDARLLWLAETSRPGSTMSTTALTPGAMREAGPLFYNITNNYHPRKISQADKWSALVMAVCLCLCNGLWYVPSRPFSDEYISYELNIHLSSLWGRQWGTQLTAALIKTGIKTVFLMVNENMKTSNQAAHDSLFNRSCISLSRHGYLLQVYSLILEDIV